MPLYHGGHRGPRGWCIRRRPSKHGVSSRLLACSGTSRLSPFSALVSTPAAPNGNLILRNTCYGTSCTSWSPRCEKIRWKECGNELLPCECLLLLSSLALHPAASSPSKAQRGEVVLVGYAGTPPRLPLTHGHVSGKDRLFSAPTVAFGSEVSPLPLSNTCFPVSCKRLGKCLPDNVLEQIFVNAELLSW